MNGLEAIKVMMEGKLVSKFNSCMEDEIYKIIDGNVCVKFEDEPDENMKFRKILISIQYITNTSHLSR